MKTRKPRKRTASRPVNPDAITGFEKLHNPDSRNEALASLGQWVIDTCLFFGCRPELAYQVAAEFTKGLRFELNRSPDLLAEAKEQHNEDHNNGDEENSGQFGQLISSKEYK